MVRAVSSISGCTHLQSDSFRKQLVAPNCKGGPKVGIQYTNNYCISTFSPPCMKRTADKTSHNFFTENI
jgi:hypothetical protein